MAAPSSPTPGDDRPLDGAYVSRQRTALRDLLELSAECAERDRQVEEAYRAEGDGIARRHDRLDQFLHRRRARLTEALDVRQATQRGRLEARIEQARKDAAANNERWLEQIRDQGAADVEQLTQKLNHALWLADSLLEGAEAKLRDQQGELRDESAKQEAALDVIEAEADRRLHRYRQGYRLADLPAADHPARSGPAGEVYQQAHQQAGLLRKRLMDLGAPKWFSGWRLPLALVLPLLIAAGATGWVGYVNDWDVGATVQAAVFALLGGYSLLVLLGAIAWYVAKRQVRDVALPLRQALDQARLALTVFAEHSRQEAARRREQARQQRLAEAEVAKTELEPAVAERRRELQEELDDAARQIELVTSQQDAENAEQTERLADKQEQQRESLQARYERYLAAAAERCARLDDRNRRRYDAERSALQSHWAEGLQRIEDLVAESRRLNEVLDVPWLEAAARSREQAATDLHLVRFGQLTVDIDQIAGERRRSDRYRIDVPPRFALPAMLAFPQQGSLLINTQRDGREHAVAALHAVMLRLLTSLPPGRVRFCLMDPVGLGQNFAGFMHLADYDEAIVGPRIWSESEHVERQLVDLTQHMENVIQKYLRNDFDTIVRYNEQAGELAEPFRFVVIADFPSNFTDEAGQRLLSIIHSGPRCGVYTLMVRSVWQELPHGVQEEDLRANSVVLTQEGGALVWDDEVYGRFELTVDAPPDEDVKTEVFRRVGEGAQQAANVEVPFAAIAPGDEQLWAGETTRDVRVPMGRSGATRLQQLTLGRGMAQHVLIAGKTGSGKSTLLHVLITNLALWYGPDEMQFYLIDFKKGVEFKTYATHRLPHARAIAIESDREFGVSVLEELDAEMNRRGERFRAVGAQDLPAYRQARPDERMPRTLLLIDEFQELFTEDDRLNQRAGLLLDRLVRQGRAFGIHVLLGSQTLGGTTGLPRGTMGQMAVRIALQCSEADSQMVLSDDNTAAKLLSRPGEAIYNDAGGLIEGNSPFQVSWLPDAERDEQLRRIAEQAAARGTRIARPIVFEGHAPADLADNPDLAECLAHWPPAARPAEPRAWVGEPITIKAPTAARFRRQSGANLLLVGQQDESALAVMAASLVSLAAQHAAGEARFFLLDGTPPDSPAKTQWAALAAALPQELSRAEGRDVADALAEIAAEVQRRLDGDRSDEPPIFLLVHGLQRLRMLRKSEDDFSFSYSEESKDAAPRPDKQFAEILREGPAFGIHTIAWCDTLASLERTLDRQSVREFDYRLLFQMGAIDSSNLIDSPEANRLGFYRALLFSEEHGYQEKFRPYAFPSKAWLADFPASGRDG